MVDRRPCPLFLSPLAERPDQQELSPHLQLQRPHPRFLYLLATRPGWTLRKSTQPFKRNPCPRLLLTLATRLDSTATLKSSRTTTQNSRWLPLLHLNSKLNLTPTTMKMTLRLSPCLRSMILIKRYIDFPTHKTFLQTGLQTT